MKVRMRTLAAGPDGVFSPGEVVDLPEREASALVKGGYAESIGETPSAERKVPEPPENKPAADKKHPAAAAKKTVKKGK